MTGLRRDTALTRESKAYRLLSEAGPSFLAASRAAAVCLSAALLLCVSAPCFAAPQPLDKPAPDFARTGLAGVPIHLKAFRGKVVLLNFWATWCAPCLQEMPLFAQWQTRYGPQGFQALGVSMDDTDDPVKRLQFKLQLNYPLIMGDAKLGELYGGILGLPVTYLIDRQGRIRARYQGETDPQTIEKELRLLLTAPTSPSPHR